MNRTRFVYLHGFASSPQSRKAQFFRRSLARHGVELEIPELEAGGFARLTVTRELEIVDGLARGEKLTLLGSSLGGYLASLYAARHPERVERVLLMAPAFRLAERWAQRTGAEALERWQREGSMEYFHYGANANQPLGWEFLEDARRHPAYPEFRHPAVIFHGDGDTVVPLEDSLEYVSARPWVRLQVMRSDHELGNCLEALWQQSAEFLLSGDLEPDRPAGEE